MTRATTRNDPLPRWEGSGRAGHALLMVALGFAPLLLIAAAVRLAGTGELGPAHVLVVAVALVAADFLSGLVHWAADTWGSERWPVIGPRVLRPFRLHHVNPGDLLQRSFVDCNGDVALISGMVLLGVLALPAHTEPWTSIGVFLTALAGWSLPVNQVHQWAHDPSPPWIVRTLQRCHLVLARADHAEHHEAPYATHYCILTGWWNRPLSAVAFFPRLERLVAQVTGLRPRAEDESFAAEHLS
jgi:ubiquitin-conjugating enzyme E2 variant